MKKKNLINDKLDCEQNGMFNLGLKRKIIEVLL